MKWNRLFYPAILCLCLIPGFVGCRDHKTGFVVKGTVLNPIENSSLIFHWDDGTEHRDTLRVQREFTLRGTLSYPSLCEITLVAPGRSPIRTQFFLDQSPMTLRIPDRMEQATLYGSEENDRLLRLQYSLRSLQEPIDSLEKTYDTGVTEWRAKKEAGAPQSQLDTLLTRLHGYEDTIGQLEDLKAPAFKKFIYEHPDSFVSAYALTSWQGMYISPTEARPAYDLLATEIKATAEMKRWEEALAFFEKTAPGKPAPDFTEPDCNGTPIGLSDFRGTHALLLFWASWCRPCREENRELVKLWEHLEGKAIVFIGIAMDNDKDAWMDAKEKDGIPWVNLCDFQLRDGEAASRYIWNTRNQAYTLPQNVLIDSEGTIIGRNLALHEIGSFIRNL